MQEKHRLRFVQHSGSEHRSVPDMPTFGRRRPEMRPLQCPLRASFSLEFKNLFSFRKRKEKRFLLYTAYPHQTHRENLPGYNKKTPPGFPGGAVRACRAGPIITCTKGQVGRLSSVSLLPTSDRSREACNPQIQIGIPYERCGFNGP